MSRTSRRIGKPTTAGWVLLGTIVILAVAVVVGVVVGGGTGATIDAVAGVLIAAFIFVMFGAMTPRRRGDDPRDQFDRPPGPNEYR